MMSREEKQRLAGLMLRESPAEKAVRERTHRALPEAEQPPMVVCLGVYSYRILWVAPHGGPEGHQLAQTELRYWQEHAERGGLEVLPQSRNISPHDLDVRTQHDLDALVRAIHEGYEINA